MKTLAHDELKSLTEWEQSPCISIYLPRHQALSDYREDPIHLRNMLDQAETALQERGMGTGEIKTLLEPARKIQSDGNFWGRGPAQGICILLAPGMFQQYDLFYQCPQSLTVEDSFYVNPLFYKVYENNHFDLLAVCPKSVRLIRHQNGELKQLDLPENVPENIEAISSKTQFEESLQHHTTSHVGPGSDNASMMHGHGLTKELNETLLTDYFQILAKQLEKYLDNDGPPMILIASEKQQSMFRKHYHAKNLLEQGISTSPDHLNEKELYEASLPVIEQITIKPLRKAREQYQKHLGTSRITHQLEAILQAADEGRIEALFAPLGSELWGQPPSDGELVKTHDQPMNGDIALLNRAIRNTYKHGGIPYVVAESDMPEDKPVAAYLRW